MNIAEIELELKELVEQPASFIFQLLEIYNAPKATVTKLRQGSGNQAKAAGDVLLKNKLFFRVAQTGRAAVTVDAMAAEPLTSKHKPRFLFATDGAEVYCRDTKVDQSIEVAFGKLNNSFDFFLPLAGVERYDGVAENPADVKATGRLAKLYDAILEANPDWIGRNHTHELNLFMTRLLFCFFAENTSIFTRRLFSSTVFSLVEDSGANAVRVLESIFLAMNTPTEARDNLPEYARRFPYVNGGLFSDQTPVPKFSKRARRLLKECGDLNWSEINPDIFGSMIQAVVEPEMRGDMGLHYTSVPNIMKVLQPLFLLSIEEDFEAARDSEIKLRKLLDRVYNMRVFDPACGSGNFLIIAYRELRKLETRIFQRLKDIAKQGSLPITRIQEADIIYTGEDNVIAIRGFAEPSTPRTRQILESDLNDLSAAIFQDEAVLRAAMNPEEYAPEVVNQVFIPKVIERQYPDLTPQEVEEVRQAVVANGVFKSPSVEVAPQGDNKFVRMAEKLINLDQLDIDLIDSINPFQRAYEILSKSVTADVLRTIHGAITSVKAAMTEEEAVALYPRIKDFVKERKVEPSLVSPNPLERRMAEALAWIRDAKRKRMAADPKEA